MVFTGELMSNSGSSIGGGIGGSYNYNVLKHRQIEDRAVDIANYIVETGSTVRQTAKAFGISKSTVHMVVTNWSG